MTALYVGLTIFFFFLCIPVCYLAYHYYTRQSIKTIPLHCAIWHFIALYTCVIAFPLLVVDINAAFHAPTPQTWMRPLWMTIFAMSYFCAWISLPIAQMYTEVGDFEWRKALWHSVKLNLKLYSIIVTLILLVLIYLVIMKGAYDSLASTGKVVISLANSWGLLMLILFMPAGLVGVPRLLWRHSDPSRQLCRILFEAVDLQEDLDLAAMDLGKVKAEIVAIDPLVADEDRPHLVDMLEMISHAEQEIPMYRVASQRIRIQPRQDTHDISIEHLEELNAKLKKAVKLATRINYRWLAAVRACDLLDRLSRGIIDESDPVWKRTWYRYRRQAYLVGCGVCSVLTVIILWNEITLPFRMLTTFPLGLIEVLMKVPALQFITSVIFLFYMACCSFWAAFQFKVFNIYVMYPSIADNASLCFNEVFLVRLLMPLCFNFLLMAGLATSSEDVQYGHVYRRNMDISLLFGTAVNQFLPLVIPIVAAIVFFKLSGRVMGLLGIEIYHPDDVFKPAVQQRIEHGKRLVEEDLGHPLGDIRRTADDQIVIVMEEDNTAVYPHDGGSSGGDGEGGVGPENRNGGGSPVSPYGDRGGSTSHRYTGDSTAMRAGRAAPRDRGARYKEYLAKKRAAAEAGDDGMEKEDENA